MEASKIQIMKETQITLKDHILAGETGTILLPQISRIWTGRPSKGMPASLLLVLLLFVTAAGAVLTMAAACLTAVVGTAAGAVVGVILGVIIGASAGAVAWPAASRRKNAINMELSSGVICSFLVSGKEFSEQVCKLVGEYAAGNETSEVTIILLDGEEGILRKDEETEEKPAQFEKTGEYERESNTTSLTALDLRKLYEYEKEKETPDQALLALIVETIPIAKAGNRQESKAMFTKFIEAGLIQECNELGLNSLIKDIKSSIY